MTAYPSIVERTARPAVWTLTLLLTAMPLAGCYGGPSVDPQLEAQQRELSQQTVDTSEGLEEARRERAAAERDAEDAGMDEETEPAPLDHPQPAEPAPDSGAPVADDSGHCGNGVLDDDEICEIGIPDGEPGACPSECGSDECMDPQGCWTVCLPKPPESECP